MQDAPRSAWLFTSESARASVQIALKNKAEAKAKAEALAKHASNTLSDSEAFREQRAVRAREHMRLLQEKIDAELAKAKPDTKALRELSDTLAKFELVEQKLSGRASPGSLRPSSRKPDKDRQSYAAPEPTSEEPE